jgi:hypothetical protein
MNDCTTMDCRNETSTYLCTACVSDLQAWIDRVTEVRQMLFTTMAKLDVTGPKNSEGGGGGSTGSSMPLRDGAMDKRYALAMWEGLDAAELAKDKHAGGFLKFLQTLIEEAEKLVDLPGETWEATCVCGETVISELDSATCLECGANNRKNTLQATKARKVAPDLVDAKDLVDWIKTYTGHDVTENQIYIWANRGLIPQAQKKPPRYDPLAVAISKGLHKHAV